MKKNVIKVPRNTFVVAMKLGRKAGRMKDRRAPRGGAKNRQREFLSEV